MCFGDQVRSVEVQTKSAEIDVETQSNTSDFLRDGSQTSLGRGMRGGNMLDGSYVDSVGAGISSRVRWMGR